MYLPLADRLKVNLEKCSSQYAWGIFSICINFQVLWLRTKVIVFLCLSQCFHSYRDFSVETTDVPALCTQSQLPRFFWSSHFGEVTCASRSQWRHSLLVMQSRRGLHIIPVRAQSGWNRVPKPAPSTAHVVCSLVHHQSPPNNEL